ncbi:hypothetical protein IU500_12570 [Nocardia terpenica]|uniref:hypothetical protein n=1 Tax=Nocardia terpenica TaxID=455432 RepID=UPI0018946601|nr:hypothetical protein [Nocardia terpenica]MBF6062988.1 hypothetical protein [Nocardia terpenica]MBF6104877.1 hypothetical protein [Nocardia terpenica]MBF6112686.1 hypothetical protein [Nocardia terpenica]MBF6118605.1 hypothetical protein [Nocardia terpenica]MBF6155084.1 hypothetical protein [Nocardia terpenica]
MKPLRRATIGTSAVLFAATGIAAAGAGTAHAAQSCGFDFTWSQPMVLAPQIIARGIAQCDVPPEEHILTLALEYQNHGVWENATYRTDRTIPPGPPNFASYEVSAACYAGTWRMTMNVTGSLRGQPFAFSDHSQSRDIPPSQCPSR